MADEPTVKRAVAFFDGQNLFNRAKEAFGHNHPNYDPTKLFDAVCAGQGWQNRGVRFYTGVPTRERDAFWHEYWGTRLLAMRHTDILVESRPLHYQKHEVERADGLVETYYVPREKGIDLRLGLDLVRLARNNQYDVAVIFSQDQDMVEAVQEVKTIARETNRWIKVACAFPDGSAVKRGINHTDWHRIRQAVYDACLDPRDYRPRRSG